MVISLTAILISHFITNLQEANLRSVKVDSDDPLHLSTHSDNSLPSFVDACGATGSIANHTGEEIEGCVSRLGEEEVGGSTRHPQHNPTEVGEIEGEEVLDSSTQSMKV